MIRAIFFDCGGVLHTSEHDPQMERAFATETLQTLEEQGVVLGLSPEAFLKTMMPRTGEYKKYSEEHTVELPAARIWAEFYLKDFNIATARLESCAERLCYLFDAHRKRLIPRPNLLKTVQELHALGLRQGVISNIISRNFVPERVAAYGIAPYMECVVLSSVTGIRKPNAEIFYAATKQMGLAPAECAYVGDRISRDVVGSRNAGMGYVIQIHYKESELKDAALAEKYQPDVMIDDLSEIPAIISRINSEAGNA